MEEGRICKRQRFLPAVNPPLAARCKSCTTRGAVSRCPWFQCHTWCRLSGKQGEMRKISIIRNTKGTKERRIAEGCWLLCKALKCQVHQLQPWEGASTEYCMLHSRTKVPKSQVKPLTKRTALLPNTGGGRLRFSALPIKMCLVWGTSWRRR